VPKYLVVLPTYNELESLPVVLERLFAHNPQVNVLIVDDASPDGTGELADRMAKADARIQVLHREAKNGLGAAYIAGFRLGLAQGFDYLIEMDADGSHRSQDLVKLIEASTNADLVIGSRWVRGGAVENWAWHRVALSRLGNLYARTLLGVTIRDMTAGFRVFRADLLAKLIENDVASAGYSFQIEMAWRASRAGAVITEVPITFVEREFGSSKMSSAIVREALWLITRWGLKRLFRF
jgi:dolichol-phosphate mannosyltransferase